MNNGQLITLFLACFPCIFILVNLFFYKKPIIKTNLTIPPLVSILIPARNEAENIAQCIGAALESDYEHLEIIVLDDHSTDSTAQIVQQMVKNDPRVRLAFSTPLPENWCGKQHACYQLAKLSKGDILLFIDADVVLAPQAVNLIIHSLLDNQFALLSGIPREITGSLAEKLIIPLIHFILLGFLPMFHSSFQRKPKFAAGCGQVMAFKRDAYWAINGHAGIFASWHDGLALSRRLRRFGYATGLADLTELCTCRMYRSFSEVYTGFLKNAAEGMGGKIAIYLWSLLLIGGQVIPYVGFIYSLLQHSADCWFWGGVVWLIYLSRLILAVQFKQSWLGGLLHPVGIILLLTIQWHGWWKAITGKPVLWKDRIKPKLPNPD